MFLQLAAIIEACPLRWVDMAITNKASFILLGLLR